MLRLDEHVDVDLLRQSARLIELAWPGKRTFQHRLDGIRKDIELKDKLPGHYVLIDDDVVVAHVKIVESETKREVGRSVCVYDVVVDQNKRKRGYGKRIMLSLEPIVKAMGYHYIYLSTSPKLASTFYKKCGYREHDAVTRKRKVFRKIHEDGLARLEALFETRKNPIKVTKDSSSSAVWLRKRVVERFFTKSSPSVIMSFNELCRVVRDRVTHMSLTKSSKIAVLRNTLNFRQIGPSCGLCALAIAYCLVTKQTIDMKLPNKLKDLYKVAKQRKFTWEGEMFRIDELFEVARTLYMNVKLSDMSSLSSRDAVKIFLSGGTIVIPYDSMFGNYEPGLLKGTRAHYCVVVGFVWDNNLGKQEGEERFKCWDLLQFSSSSDSTKTIDDDRFENLCVVFQQSGSSQVCVCSWDRLICSNAQLDGVSKDRKKKLEKKYCVEAGIRLSGRCLVFV